MSNLLLVTGASAGIGAATARLAPSYGWDRVIVHYRSDQDGAEQVAADVRSAGGDATAMQGDVSDMDDMAALFERLGTMAPGHLGLVNNAGVVSPTGSLADLTPERVRDVFAVNVFGAIEVARRSVEQMRHWGLGGSIVNVSSAAARLGSPNQYIDYAASKGAIESFTLGLAGELAGEGIRVNALRPGLIATDIHAKGGEPDRLDKIGHTPPMGRPGTAEECAHALLWLVSDKASYVTRTIMDVAGGR